MLKAALVLILVFIPLFAGTDWRSDAYAARAEGRRAAAELRGNFENGRRTNREMARELYRSRIEARREMRQAQMEARREMRQSAMEARRAAREFRADIRRF